MTLRSVCGVNAKGGQTGRESFAGVVVAPLVVRSVLAKQLTSVMLMLAARAAFKSAQVACAIPGTPITAHKTATIDNKLFVLMYLPLGVARIAHLPGRAKSDQRCRALACLLTPGSSGFDSARRPARARGEGAPDEASSVSLRRRRSRRVRAGHRAPFGTGISSHPV